LAIQELVRFYAYFRIK